MKGKTGSFRHELLGDIAKLGFVQPRILAINYMKSRVFLLQSKWAAYDLLEETIGSLV